MRSSQKTWWAECINMYIHAEFLMMVWKLCRQPIDTVISVRTE